MRLWQPPLGLKVDGFAKSLMPRRPLLPDGVDRLDLQNIRVGEAAITLSFTRREHGTDLTVLGDPSGIAVNVLP